MMLVEETQVPEAALPIDALRRHLRLGSGFAEDDLQDAVLSSFLRAALAAVEGRTGKALISRDFLVRFAKWRSSSGQNLPIAPVEAINAVTLVDRLGSNNELQIEEFRLQKDPFEPKLKPVGSILPSIPAEGEAVIQVTAGYGPSFSDLPSDLAQAVLLLAAHYYEYRDETALGQGCMPFGVTSLIARYCVVRLGAGV